MATSPEVISEEFASSKNSSRIRLRAGIESGATQAERRVAEYLRAYGLSDMLRINELTAAVVTACAGPAEEVNPQDAVAVAQSWVERFVRDVFGEDAPHVDALWLRSFIETFPRLFLGDAEQARHQAHRFGDPLAGRTPTATRFREQSFDKARLPSWAKGLIAPAALTVLAVTGLVFALPHHGLAFTEALWVSLFGFLFASSAIGLCTAGRGFVAGFHRTSPPQERQGPLPRCAVAMPIYHEDAERCFAAVAAMRESLDSCGGGDRFEIFVLSDSTDPYCAAEEERAWRRIARSPGGGVPIYYRRRALNERQKAGNLAEFFERFGQRYVYAIVLDADSLMTGEAMVSLVRRMEALPQVALLQAPLQPHLSDTLLGRAQQFAASISGPLFQRGLSLWAGPHGNYYGHNAILRVQGFLQCCALPELRGEPPLGGHILSHDFVEAALLCRSGWQVRMAHDLTGSWEEPPATMAQHVARDRRWCQGNLQHLRIVLAQGLKPMSRLHMLLGAGAYLAGPLWLGFLGLGLALASGSEQFWARPGMALSLAASTALVLAGPRLLGLWEVLSDTARRRAHGGALRAAASALLEGVFSALTAPLAAVHHAQMVGAVFAGSGVLWRSQQRQAKGRLGEVVRLELPATLLGLGMLGMLAARMPDLILWLLPVWLPWTLAVPLAWAASSPGAGAGLRRMGLLLVPSEVQPERTAQRADELRVLTTGHEAARFRDLVLDPVLLAAHLARLPNRTVCYEDLLAARERALRMGPAALSSAERDLLTGDSDSMRILHREAWRCWPVESWRVARQSQIPPAWPTD